MPATIIRRPTRREMLQDHKRDLIETSKTGISSSDVVNQAINNIIEAAKTSGAGTASAIAGTTVPILLKKRYQLSSVNQQAESRKGKQSQQ